MRAILPDEPDSPLGVPERDEVLAEEANSDRCRVSFRQFLDETRRGPIAPQEGTHQRPRTHLSEQTVVLRAHRHTPTP